MDLVFVRHGMTDWNEAGRLMGRSDVPLNERGRAQADAIAGVLRSAPVTQIWSSPQRRAQETAQSLARALRLQVQSEPALAEVWVGRWQGKTWVDLHDDPDVQRYLHDPTFCCDALESGAAVRERIVTFLERLRADDAAMSVVVSHGDPIRIALAHYLSLGIAGYRRLEVAPGSVSVLRFHATREPRAVLLNWRPYKGDAQLRQAPAPAGGGTHGQAG